MGTICDILSVVNFFTCTTDHILRKRIHCDLTIILAFLKWFMMILLSPLLTPFLTFSPFPLSLSSLFFLSLPPSYLHPLPPSPPSLPISLPPSLPPYLPPNSAMAKFKGLDKRAQAGTGETSITSTHQNAITQIFPHTMAGDNMSKFSTTGVDGRLVVWDIKSLESAVAGLKFQ